MTDIEFVMRIWGDAVTGSQVNDWLLMVRLKMGLNALDLDWSTIGDTYVVYVRCRDETTRRNLWWKAYVTLILSVDDLRARSRRNARKNQLAPSKMAEFTFPEWSGCHGEVQVLP